MNWAIFPSARLLAVAVLFFLTGTLGKYPPGAQDFTVGNGRYAAGDYAGAVKVYEGAVHAGWFSANLFYNLGNAYYRLGDKGRAVLNYRRCLLLDPSQAEAAANLAFVNGGKPVRDGRGFARRGWSALSTVAAVSGWSGLAGLLLAVASRRRRALGIGLAAVGLLVGGGLAGLIWYLDDGTGPAATAIVVAEATPALYSPADNSKVVTTLPAGGEVRVLSEQGAWIYALLGDGTTRAWLSADKVERLVPR